MLELAYDIAKGATYKFNTAFMGEQVRILACKKAVCSSGTILCPER